MKEVTEKVIAPEDKTIALQIIDATLSWEDPEKSEDSTFTDDSKNADVSKTTNGAAQDAKASTDSEDAHQGGRLLDGIEPSYAQPYALQNIDLTVKKVNSL